MAKMVESCKDVGLAQTNFDFALWHFNFNWACMFVAYVQEGKNILWWLKIVVTNIVFWNCMTFNFYQTNIKKVFVNYTQNKVIQLPNNAIVRSSNYI
jgi:L-lactate permease